MKKVLIAILLLSFCLFASCGGGEGAMSGFGTLALTVDEETMMTVAERLYAPEYFEQFKSAGNLVYYDTLNSMLMALNAGQIKGIMLPADVNNYISQRNEGLTLRVFEDIPMSFFMGLREENTELRDQFDEAIRSMVQDGTLDALREQWIVGLPADEEPSFGEMPVIAGAETVKVGVTGDLPPLDYVSADGQPSGYNVAVLSEISQRIGMNIELVTVEATARLTALTSGNIDVIFWMRGVNSVTADGQPAYLSEAGPASGVITTVIYYEGNNSWLLKE